ncbi:MAG TPA: hypothetical protein VI731_08780, partial [Bacteroidia bacterium]|nr:hypothetical protein [Bacteroidia bacterium]
IDRRVGEKEKQFNASTSFAEKDRLQNEISVLKISSADKKQKAKDSLAAAKKAQEQPITSSVTTETKLAGINDHYANALKSTDAIADPVERENTKAVIYREWSGETNTLLEKKKLELASATSQSEKDKINQDIGMLTRAADEKKQQADQSTASSIAARQTEPLAAGDNADERFARDLVLLEAIADEVERESAKAKLFTDWAADIDRRIIEKDNQYNASANFPEKEKLQDEIYDLKISSADKKKKARESLAAANRAGEQPVAGNSFDLHFQRQLNRIEAQPETAERENARADLYSAWADSLDAQAANQEKQLAGTRNKTQKEQLNKTIAQTRAKAEHKRAQAANAKNNALAIAERLKAESMKPTEELAYTAPGTAAAQEKNQQLLKQADAARNRQDSLTRLASAAQGPERTQLLVKATDAQREAWNKEMEASSAIGTANMAQFIANKKMLDAFAAAAATSNDPAIATAELLALEAEELFATAQRLRESSKTAGDNYYLRRENLKNAEANELQALKQQQDALARYEKTELVPVATGISIRVTEGSVIAQPAVDPSTGTAFTPEKKLEIRKDATYREYLTDDRNAVEAEKRAAELKTQYDSFQQKAKSESDVSMQLTFAAAGETDPAKKRDLFNQSEKRNEAAKANIASRDSIDKLLPAAEREAKEKRASADRVLANLDEQEAGQMRSLAAEDNQSRITTGGIATGPVATSAIATSPGQPRSTITQPATGSSPGTATTGMPIPTGESVTQHLSPGETFRFVSTETTPVIQPNPTLPAGVVFKVQIGAFRSQISPEAFKGIEPLTSELTQTGLTRYTAGLFTDLGHAGAARNEIRARGYSDAFVVAFYNGNRISVAEARRISGIESTAATPIAAGVPVGVPANIPAGTPTQTSPEDSGPVAVATEVNTVGGLFYTVQVGVYSRPVSASRLLNLTGLFLERTTSGNYRYSAGKYSSVAAASIAKNTIVTAGISDAFVTAYYNGERITLERARALETSGTVPVPTEIPAVIGTNGIIQPQPAPSNPQPSGSSQPMPSRAFVLPVADTGLVFSVQLGAFSQEVPLEVANKFLLLASRGVKIYVDPVSNFTIYQVGEFARYEEAVALRNEAVEKGIADAFIVAWKNGKKIPMEEALGR